MPDHIAELFAEQQKSLAIVSQRVEPDLTSARDKVAAHYRTGLLTAADAKVLVDAPLDGAKGTAHLYSIRTGEAGSGRMETVILLVFPTLPLIEVVARYDEADVSARDAVLALARSLRCTS